MSETKSKESHQRVNLILVGQYALKTCIYRGKTHNWYLALNQAQPGTYFMVRLVMQIANTNIDSIQEEEKILRKLVDSIVRVNQFRMSPMLWLQVIHAYKILTTIIKFLIALDPVLNYVSNLSIRSLHYQQYVLQQFKWQATPLNQLNILEKVHAQSIVHRSLKPKKILTQIGKNELVLIDFKHSVKYKHKNGKFIGYGSKFSNLNKLTKYSSLNQHLGLTASPKDDLESLGFILIYFLKKGDMFKTKENGSKNKKMEEQKLRMVPEKFCKDMPIEILQYFQFIRMTNVSQYPLGDYEFLKKLFRNLLQQINVSEKDYQYDWIKKMTLQTNQQQQQQQPQKEYTNPIVTQTKIVIHQPQNLEGIQEVQTELERSSIKREFFRQMSSLCISDEEDKQFESVSVKMRDFPNMFDLIKLKN